MTKTRRPAPRRDSPSPARFRLLNLLGIGGTAEVYEALDLRLDRHVALKFIVGSRSLRAGGQRLLREARIAARCHHPNICVVHEVTEHAQRPCLVMEPLHGCDLKAAMTTTRFTWRDVVAIGLGVSQGLATAHRAGVVHLDVKPANLFLTTDKRVKILDFGAASRQTTVPIRLRSVLGTAEYIAPERLVGCPAIPQSDLFSLGAVLYELLTGRKAFAGDTHAETLLRILDHTPEPVRAFAPGVPATLDHIVMRLLSKRCRERFGAAEQVGTALASVAAIRELGRIGDRSERTGATHVEAA